MDNQYITLLKEEKRECFEFDCWEWLFDNKYF